jgi:hypothetical protein
MAGEVHVAHRGRWTEALPETALYCPRIVTLRISSPQCYTAGKLLQLGFDERARQHRVSYGQGVPRMGVRREDEHGAWEWKLHTRCQVHAAMIVAEAASPDKRRADGCGERARGGDDDEHDHRRREVWREAPWFANRSLPTHTA